MFSKFHMLKICHCGVFMCVCVVRVSDSGEGTVNCKYLVCSRRKLMGIVWPIVIVNYSLWEQVLSTVENGVDMPPP